MLNPHSHPPPEGSLAPGELQVGKDTQTTKGQGCFGTRGGYNLRYMWQVCQRVWYTALKASPWCKMNIYFLPVIDHLKISREAETGSGMGGCGHRSRQSKCRQWWPQWSGLLQRHLPQPVMQKPLTSTPVLSLITLEVECKMVINGGKGEALPCEHSLTLWLEITCLECLQYSGV